MIDPNDPAFQTSEIVKFNSGPALATMGGLTKREYFAARAMQGFLSVKYDFPIENTEVVRLSLKYADTLITELNKEPLK